MILSNKNLDYISYACVPRNNTRAYCTCTFPVLWDPYYNVLQFKFNSKFLTTPTSKFNDELDSSFFFLKILTFFFHFILWNST